MAIGESEVWEKGEARVWDPHKMNVKVRPFVIIREIFYDTCCILCGHDYKEHLTITTADA
jgi:hypothetical protein